MLVGRPGLSPQMIGRAEELDRLALLVEAGQSPAIALVGGEAGVGKTRLVRELVARLPEGVAVHAGQADPGSLGRPFELLIDALDGTGRADDRIELLGDSTRPTDERVRLALDIVHGLTVRTPSVVVFDDLHWADSESVALFERLAEPDSGPLLLVGTYRPDALHRRHPTAEMVPRLERRHAVTHLHLDRLDASEVGSFLAAVYGRQPSYRTIQALHARTGGNPFFLEELLAAGRDDDPDALLDQELPWSLAELVRAQLDDLGPEARRALETAAVLGVTRVGFDLLATVSGYGEDDLIAILRVLVARGLLVESEADVFAFRHALAREAIEADLLGRERRRLHQAALDALRAADSRDFAGIANHAHGAGQIDDMVAAARKGAVRSLHAGSTYQALQLAELGLSEVPTDPELLDVASRAAWLSGLLVDARTFAGRSLELAARAAEDLEAESAALRLICRLDYDVSDAEATARSTEALEALVDRLDEGPEQAKACAVLAQMHMLRDDLECVTIWADRATALADRLDLPDVRVRVDIERGSAYMNVKGRVDEGRELLGRAIDEATEQEQWVIVARGLNNLVRGEYSRLDAENARALLLRMREATERAGFDLFAGSYWDGLADLAEWEGDLGDALTQVEEAMRAQRDYARGRPANWFLAHAAGLALEAGEVDRAETIFAMVDPAVGENALWWTGLGLHIAAIRHDEAGVHRYGAALTRAAIARGAVDPQLVHDLVRAMLHGDVDPDAVEQLLDGLPIGFGQPTPHDDPYRLLARAELLEARGDPEGALELYDASIARSGSQVRPAALGSAHVGAGRCLVALRRIGEAKEHAATADELLARWGGARVEELAALQRRLGGGESVEGPDALTPREREVVALLAEGLTNGEIASRLFISPKTASVHVSNILAKLSMTSRTEVAAYAVRAGWADA